MPQTSMSSKAVSIGNNLTYWASTVKPPWAGLVTLTFIFNGYADAWRAKHVKKIFLQKLNLDIRQGENLTTSCSNTINAKL
jgi:hypothetical protein